MPSQLKDLMSFLNTTIELTRSSQLKDLMSILLTPNSFTYFIIFLVY